MSTLRDRVIFELEYLQRYLPNDTT
jgi:hypothetical protein